MGFPSKDIFYALLAVPLGYALLSTIGRMLKRRAGVPLGIPYLLLSASISILVPFSFVPINPEVLRALATATLVFATLVLLRLLRRYYWEGYVRRLHANRVPEFVRQVIDLNILALVAIAVLYFLYGYRIPGLLAGSGIAALILGLAVQDLLGNVIAGYAVHSEKAFRPGDWLLWEQQHVQVVETNWRATRLRNNDDVHLDVPNSVLAKAVITNFTYPAARHGLRVSIPVDRNVAPSRVKDVLHRAARGAEGVLTTPSPRVFLAGFTEWAATYEIRIWIDDHSRYNEILDLVRTNAWYELCRARIAIPYPTHSVQIARGLPDATPGLHDVAGALATVPVFQPLSLEQREGLGKRARQLRFGRGERIVEQGAPGSSMFVLLSGAAEVSLRPPGKDRSLPVATLHAGDCFGEMSLLTGEQRTAAVTATEDSDVLEIVKEDLAEILREHPTLADALSQLAAQRRLATEGAVAQGLASGNPRSDVTAATVLRRLREFFAI